MDILVEKDVTPIVTHIYLYLSLELLVKIFIWNVMTLSSVRIPSDRLFVPHSQLYNENSIFLNLKHFSG